MALPATANFTGANDTQINSLADWDGAGNLATDGLDIQSNEAQADSAQQGANWWTSDSFDNDQYSQATVTAITSGIYIGVSVRASGTDGGANLTEYHYVADSADAGYIEKYVSGSYTGLTSDGSVFSASDDIYIEVNSTAIVAKLNGSEDSSTTDSSIASGAAGITAYGDGASRIDDWEGGDLSTDLSISVSDTITVNESLTQFLDALFISVADTITVNEGVTVTLVTTGALEINVADTITVNESTAQYLDALFISAAETITVGEAVTVSRVDDNTLYISVSDTLAITESVVAQLDQLYIDVAETITVAEVITAAIPGSALSISVSDTITIAELITAIAHRVPSFRIIAIANEDRVIPIPGGT